MTTPNNGHGRTSFAVEFQFACEARRLPRPARRTLLDLFRRARSRRSRRVFWELDPATGDWHLL